MYPYRTSKAAVNMMTRSMASDLGKHNVKSIAIHPGWVKTDMGGPHAPLTPEESIEGVLNVMDNITDDMNGKLYDYFRIAAKPDSSHSGHTFLAILLSTCRVSRNLK